MTVILLGLHKLATYKAAVTDLSQDCYDFRLMQ